MEDVIRRIQAKELYNTHLLKNQTSILDRTINVTRTRNDEMERRVRHMETHVTDLKNTIRTGNMAQASSELTATAGHIKRTQTAVINIIAGLKRGIVSPALISVSQLRKELINIQAHLSKRRRLPVTHETMHDVYQVMVSEVQELDDEEEYDVYQLTPIPVAIQNDIIATETETKYLVISDHRDRYFALTVEKLNQFTKMSKGPMLCNIKQTTLGPAHEQFQCALAAVKAEQKPGKINTTSIWYPLHAPNSWTFATTQEITLTYVCGEERGKIQVHNNGIVTMNADCISRSPIVTLQGHPALRSTIEKKPATIITHSFKRPIEENHQDTTTHSSSTSNLNHLQGEVHQLQEQIDRKVAQHGSNARNPQYDGVVSCQRAEHTTNWTYDWTATRRTVAAQYSADAASIGHSVKTLWDSSTSSILLKLQRRRPVNKPEAKLGQHKCRSNPSLT